MFPIKQMLGNSHRMQSIYGGAPAYRNPNTTLTLT